MWGSGQSACRFVLCFRKNWGERYAAASVKPCKNRPTDSVSAPQKSLHSVNLQRTAPPLSLLSAVFPVCRPPYYSTVSKLRFPPRIANAKVTAFGNCVKSFKLSFPVCRPPYCSTVSELRFSRVLRMQKLSRSATALNLSNLVFPFAALRITASFPNSVFSRVLRM